MQAEASSGPGSGPLGTEHGERIPEAGRALRGGGRGWEERGCFRSGDLLEPPRRPCLVPAYVVVGGGTGPVKMSLGFVAWETAVHA